MMIMANRGFYYAGDLPASTTLFDFHPGVINTKMLLSAYGKVGIDTEKYKTTFNIISNAKISPRFDNPGGLPKYYKATTETEPAAEALDKEACLKAYNYLSELVAKDFL